MKRWRTSRLALVLLALSGAVLAAEPPSRAAETAAAPVARTFSAARLARLGDYFTSLAETRQIPGAVVLVQQHGRPVYSGSFGRRDGRQPMTGDTIFRLYSMSKPITSVAAMMLVEDGALKLDDAVSKFIP